MHQESPRSDIFRKRATKPLLKQKHSQKHLTWAKVNFKALHASFCWLYGDDDFIFQHLPYLYLCIFSCVCIPYNCTVHGADLTYISLLVIFCIIVYVTNTNFKSWILKLNLNEAFNALLGVSEIKAARKCRDPEASAFHCRYHFLPCGTPQGLKCSAQP